ncbi:M48 family metalloprotease [Tropicimonas sp. S265A]|uniref:M48 family metalloprotease n=1 Tax=Tropicimonas sp. S265A TaxID=3415134 RepID=UPI003C7A8CF5
MHQLKHFLTTLCLICATVVSTLPANGQSLIRDAEIERSLRELAAPLMNAAGLGNQRMNFWILDDSKMNAFVAGPKTIILHSGLLFRLETPEMVQAVLAHEIAHIANGHLSRRPANLQASGRMARVGLALALAAAAATGSAEAAVGLGVGSADAARRAFFAHTRAEEASADRSAGRYMVGAGIDPGALVDVMEVFRGQEVLTTARQDPYVRTHPLTRDRLRAAQGMAAAANVPDRDRSASAYWYARLQGKLSAFLRNPNWTQRRIGNRTDEVALMRRAIAYHKTPDPERAIATMDKLLSVRPNDPYYNELLGQILFESRRYPQAVEAYRRAVALAPREAQIQAGLGRALLALKTSSATREALNVLQRAYSRDPVNPRLLRDLAQAYAETGQSGMASITVAERYALAGRLDDAAVQARRASGLLPAGSPGARRAQDIIRSAERSSKARR